MTKDEAKQYIDKNCFDAGGIVVLDVQRLVATGCGPALDVFDEKERKEIVEEAAASAMRAQPAIRDALRTLLETTVLRHVAYRPKEGKP